jgi:peroxiredoxin
MIEQGQALPAGTLTRLTGGGVVEVPTEPFFADRRVVLFALPGAFTPTCSGRHLPGFVAKAAAIKAKGVDEIVCLSVNDAFVMDAWGKSAGAEGAVTLLADADAGFTGQLGLATDTGRRLGVRSRRYAMLVENGRVSKLWLEEPGQFQVSSADDVLAAL